MLNNDINFVCIFKYTIMYLVGSAFFVYCNNFCLESFRHAVFLLTCVRFLVRFTADERTFIVARSDDCAKIPDRRRRETTKTKRCNWRSDIKTKQGNHFILNCH